MVFAAAIVIGLVLVVSGGLAWVCPTSYHPNPYWVLVVLHTALVGFVFGSTSSDEKNPVFPLFIMCLYFVIPPIGFMGMVVFDFGSNDSMWTPPPEYGSIHGILLVIVVVYASTCSLARAIARSRKA